jgi:hypothetical protein
MGWKCLAYVDLHLPRTLIYGQLSGVISYFNHTCVRAAFAPLDQCHHGNFPWTDTPVKASAWYGTETLRFAISRVCRVFWK